MALPVTFPSGNLIFNPAEIGPFQSSAGKYYAILSSAGLGGDLEAHFATDPTDSFAETDAAGAPTFPGVFIRAYDVYQVGDVLHIATQDGTDRQVEYHTFDMAAGTNGEWVITNELIENPDAGFFESCNIVVRSGGDVIVMYHGTQFNTMGSDFQRVVYARRVATVWTVGITVDGAGVEEQSYFPGNMVITSADRVHMLFKSNTDDDLLLGTLLDDNTWGQSGTTTPAPTTVDAAISNNIYATGRGVVYGSPEKIATPYLDAGGNVASVARFDDADDPTTSVDADVSGGEIVLIHSNGNLDPCVAICANGEDLHILYTRVSDEDLYRHENIADAGWGLEIFVRALGPTGSPVLQSCNVYERAGNNRLGFIYEDDDVLFYDELDLGAAGGGGPGGGGGSGSRSPLCNPLFGRARLKSFLCE